MARRRAGKANPKDAGPRGGGRRGKTKASDSKAPDSKAILKKRLAALERECDSLRAALEAEQARRRALEEVHAATRDRISWALDSLQTILSAKT